MLFIILLLPGLRISSGSKSGIRCTYKCVFCNLISGQLAGLFTIVKGTTFLSASTLTMVAKHVALYGILALGMTFVIITGGIDLSVGSVVGLVGMLAGGMIQDRKSVV